MKPHRMPDLLRCEGLVGPLPHPTQLRCAAFSPDGTRLAVGCGATYATARVEQASARIVLVDTSSERVVANLEGSRATVYAVAWSPDAAALASYDVRFVHGGQGNTHTVRRWDLATGAIAASRTAPMHRAVTWTHQPQFSSCRTLRWPAPGRIVVGDGLCVTLWTEGLKPRGTLALGEGASRKQPSKGPEDRVLALDATPDGGTLLVVGATRGLALFAAAPAEAPATALRERAGLYCDAALSPDGALVAAIEAGEPSGDPRIEGLSDRELSPPESPRRPKRVHVFSTADLAPRWSAAVADGNVQRLAFSPDGAVLYAADASEPRVTLRSWRARDGADLGARTHPTAAEVPVPQNIRRPDSVIARGLAVSGDAVAVVTRSAVSLFRVPAT